MASRKGTGMTAMLLGIIVTAFRPVMGIWFLTLAALGIPWIISKPFIITALSPHWAILFAIERPGMAFIAMGTVVLTITGAEALYADMGHVGAPSIRLAWFAVVLPCLLINYLGQGAMILEHPDWIDNPFSGWHPAGRRSRSSSLPRWPPSSPHRPSSPVPSR